MGKSCQMACTDEHEKRTQTSIKNNVIERWSRDGRVKKYTNKICRDNHIHYTSLRLLFLISYHAPACWWSIGAILNNLNLLILVGGGKIGLDHCITAWLVNFCANSKASVGMCSGCDYPYKSCSCTFWPCHPYTKSSSFNYIVFYTLSYNDSNVNT